MHQARLKWSNLAVENEGHAPISRPSLPAPTEWELMASYLLQFHGPSHMFPLLKSLIVRGYEFHCDNSWISLLVIGHWFTVYQFCVFTVLYKPIFWCELASPLLVVKVTGHAPVPRFHVYNDMFWWKKNILVKKQIGAAHVRCIGFSLNSQVFEMECCYSIRYLRYL
jgi:hypothetical protein